MKIILKEYVKNLGEKNDVVEVKNGYARNFLIPQGLAVLATTSMMKVVAENQRQAAHRTEHIIANARKLAESMMAHTITIQTLAGVDGKLFGSVTPVMIVNRFHELGFEVDRKRVSFNSEIKTTGTYTVTVDLHKEVKAVVPIEVIAKES